MILIFITLFFGCKEKVIIKENQKVSEFDYDNAGINNALKFVDNSFGGETATSENSKIESGQYAKYNDGKISPFRIGTWKKYYQNGQLKAKGNYLIGRYVQCCYSGHCVRHYNYKVGNWKYYYEDGTLELDGNYSIKKMWIDTNCGGDYIKFGILDSDAKFYDINGNRIKRGIDSLKLEYEIGYPFTHQEMHLIPEKDNDTIINIKLNK
ncbi:toxin-antitoxin system YwqK family antitoxin [Winogradskyella litorisediminis]|uniref:Toxin-antitoxin system YwqK family antitoxin n=1 Tax=Winogradskyella litorisediminis TaxID=1156618 RepID=A0ABW3N515_9FLAO